MKIDNLLSAFSTTRFFLLLFGLLIFFSCKKEIVEPQTGSVNFMIDYLVDDQPLVFDTIQYTNDAGNTFSVTKIEYFISDITLIDELGNESYFDDVFYMNPRLNESFQVILTDVELKDYASMRFHVGLNSDTNKTDYLPATTENQNMFWPEPMGGGYHFMKFEGHFIDSLGATLGYAMHLGTNTCLVNCVIEQPLSINEDNQVVELEMNLNEWFRNPHVYDLNSAGYIMGNQEKMRIIADNGNDVFKLK